MAMRVSDLLVGFFKDVLLAGVKLPADALDDVVAFVESHGAFERVDADGVVVVVRERYVIVAPVLEFQKVVPSVLAGLEGIGFLR